MSTLGRLPPLHAIGRSQCVDQEDPPELDEVEVDQFLIEYEQKDTAYRFQPPHAEVAATALGKNFSVVNPGNHVCKKTRDDGRNSFIHCKHAAGFGTKYSELQHLLQTKARLQLIRDYVSRINAATLFVKDLERVNREEYTTWYEVCHNTLTSPPPTNLQYLTTICEDLHIHMNHWNSIKQLVHTDPCLSVLRPSLCHEIDAVRTKLFRLRDAAIWWVDRLIHIGFRVLAHCDLERITHDTLWAITRGLEDFNSIVAAVKRENLNEGVTTLPRAQPKGPRGIATAVHTNSFRNLGESIRPVPFARVLNLVASERSKYAAVATEHFFTGSEEFLQLLGSKKLPVFPWVNEVGLPAKSKGRLSGGVDTSDYHSASGSHVSLSTAMLRVGEVAAPDLSTYPSPLVDFARREVNFAQRFLQIVCHSTTLLNKRPRSGVGVGVSHPGSLRGGSESGKGPVTAGHSPKGRLEKNLGASNGNKTNHSSLPPKGNIKNSKHEPQVSVSVVAVANADVVVVASAAAAAAAAATSKQDKRKSVSWSDAEQFSVINQLANRYMEILWQYFDNSLFDLLHALAWGGPDSMQGRLGCVAFMPDIVVLLLVKMIQQTCVKDIFPPGAVQSLMSLAQRLQVVASWPAWDSAFSTALGDQVADKCKPLPLANNRYATSTARSLREAFQPLHCSLAVLMEAKSSPRGGNDGDDGSAAAAANQDGSDASLGPHKVNLALMVPTLHRLFVLCDVATRWCHRQGGKFLSSWSLGSFLLITQSDLKLLCDEVRRAMRQCQGVCGTEGAAGVSSVEGSLLQQLGQVWQQLSDTNTTLQALSGSFVKQFSIKCGRQAREFFEDEVPVGKQWRRKNYSEPPSQPNDYVDQSLVTLIQPVVNGVGKLPATSQISVVSIAVTVMFEAWTDHILKQKIRFSVLGAHQLHLDFEHVRAWLETHLQNDEVKQSVLALDIFRYLTGIVDLLKRQPRGRSVSRNSRDRNLLTDDRSMSQRTAAPPVGKPNDLSGGKAQRDSVVPASCDVSISTLGTENNWKNMGSGTCSDYGGEGSLDPQKATAPAAKYQAQDDSPAADGTTAAREEPPAGDPGSAAAAGAGADDEKGRYTIPKMEQWLALRVQGGARSWPKLPSCFNNTQA